MNNQPCICLEKIGDNGPCPMHGQPYASGAASLFASAARDIDWIEFSNQLRCHLNGILIAVGDLLTAHNAGNGLWMISFPKRELRLFVAIKAHDLNLLAGRELVKEA